MEIEVENNHLFRYSTEIDPQNRKSKVSKVMDNTKYINPSS